MKEKISLLLKNNLLIQLKLVPKKEKNGLQRNDITLWAGLFLRLDGNRYMTDRFVKSADPSLITQCQINYWFR